MGGRECESDVQEVSGREEEGDGNRDKRRKRWKTLPFLSDITRQ